MNTDQKNISANLERLHVQEEQLRKIALKIVANNDRLQQHLIIVEAAMDLADIFRQLETNDEDLKLVQILGMRAFNAFGASLKLTISGYHQNSALILRDLLETVFLLDLFAGDRTLIERWRNAEKRMRMKDFSPVKVREILDARDGFTSKRRFEIYELFSELAAHPTMKSAWMMRPQRDGDAVIGPFMEAKTLEAVISETGRLAVQLGELIDAFVPADFARSSPVRFAFHKLKQNWIDTVYSPYRGGE